MKAFTKTFGIIAIGMVIIIGLAGCSMETAEKEEEGGSKKTATMLTPATWANGSIAVTSSGGDGEQWFKFTATASTQYIHIKFGTMNSMSVRLYNSNNDPVGDNENLRGSSGGGLENFFRTVLIGQTYYIRVTPSPWYSYSEFGTYQVAFNTSSTPPSY